MDELKLESQYSPSGKGIEFHSSPAKYKILVGGMGSGKTRMAVEEIKQLMIENPGLHIGVFRKTMPANRDTTMQEFMSLMEPELGRLNARTDTYNCVNGAKAIFRGFDEPSKFKSLNLGVVLMDEADEFMFEDFQVLVSRIRQTGSGAKPFPLHLIMVLNPVDETHWIYRTFVTNKEQFEKTGGVLELHLSTFDNKLHLPDGYIEQLMSTMGADEQNRYIHGNWGRIQRGTGVYADAFRRDLHVRKVEYNESYILQRGWDFGFNHPACVIQLKDIYGRKNIYWEILGEKQFLDTFAPRVKQECKRLFGASALFQDYCDPRGFDKSDKGMTSVEILNDHGVYPIGERNVRAYVEPGIKIVRHELSTLVQGIPLLTVSPDCPIMTTGFSGAYVYDESGQVKKDGYYEHLMDGHRYIEYNDKSNNAVKDAILKRKSTKRIYNQHTGY